MQKVNLFCIPYAGGSSQAFYGWKKHVINSILLNPIELAGRGRRFNDQLSCHIFDIVDDLYRKIKSDINYSEYAFFGHSMGSYIIYELYYKILKEGHNTPSHMFFSGAQPPQQKKSKIIHNLSDDDFKKEVISLGGIPLELIGNDDLFNFFMPILRSDFKAVEEYKCTGKKVKIQCPISILNGKNDEDCITVAKEWAEYTSAGCSFYEFEGGHFFLNDYMQRVVEIINNTLTVK